MSVEYNMNGKYKIVKNEKGEYKFLESRNENGQTKDILMEILSFDLAKQKAKILMEVKGIWFDEIPEELLPPIE